MDGNRIEQLCSYLELLCENDKTAADQHLNLLIGVYIKINAYNKLEKFVKKLNHLNEFDLNSIIEVFIIII